ncbi:MAG TPA: class I SAM-dependent methyltransferase [Xanthobacteraceae bacterium]|nr:class I SAM-dependent methyltransferase [Xanthobacteraceae bacterium]
MANLIHSAAHGPFRMSTNSATILALEVEVLKSLAEEVAQLRSAVGQLEQKMEMRAQDILLATLSEQTPAFMLETEKPVAMDSVDHRFPHGTASDSTRWPRFVAACERLFGPRLKFLDLGCAGGGLVLDFVLRGHDAMGLEGSDYSLVRQRAEWRTLKHRLMTCDITQPFKIRRAGGEAMKFDVISAWDVLEHIPEAALPGLFRNISEHLSPGGIFTGTVSTRGARVAPDGTNYHATVKPKDWWLEAFTAAGLAFRVPDPFDFEDYPRGNGNNYPANFKAHPETGFHFSLSRA